MASNNSIFTQLFSRTQSAVQSQISSIVKLTSKIQNASNNFFQKFQEKITSLVRSLLSKPKSKKDYWCIAGVYFAKKLVITSILVIGAVVYLYASLIAPNLEGKLWYAKLSVDNSKAQQFTGKAKVFDHNGTFIYKGEMKSGRPDGFGIQYDNDGKLIYKGNFSAGKYSGSGEMFNSSGNLVYSGSFDSNKYNGSGRLVNSLGRVTYNGNFENGMKSGRGTEYNPKSGSKKYYGEFANDKFEGKGVSYDSDGNSVIYEGYFKDGFFEGNGKKYEDSHLIYNGEFQSGKYSGSGILYDKKSGSVIYSGNFEDGSYSGEGKLYDSNTFKLSYTGNFVNGKKHGSGVLYDKLGVPIFEGDFRDDGIDFVSKFGQSIDDLKQIFGSESKKIILNNKILLFYNVTNCVLTFEPNSKGEYIFTKVILGTEYNFMGLVGLPSISRRNILGSPFSSTNMDLKDYQLNSISLLSPDLPLEQEFFEEKYSFEGYYIRIFYKSEGDKVEIFEQGLT